MREDRQNTRHTTVLKVQFRSASDFVSEYAENLSAGGLFVRQAHNLQALSEVDVQIELPGCGTFEVKARVAHVMTEDMAAQYKRHAGAGLQLIATPDGFQEALMGYLGRLGRRRDALVLVEDPAGLSMLDEAGFRTEATDLDRVIEQTLSSQILAIVACRASAKSFRESVAIAPAAPPVIGCDTKVDQDPLLAELDRLVAVRPA